MNKTLTQDNYFEDKRLSSSKLKAYIACPNYYNWKYVENEEELLTDALVFGKAVDCLVTTPDKFKDQFEVAKGARKDGKFIDGKHILTTTQYEAANLMSNKILAQPIMQEMFLKWEKQKILVNDECKAMLDFFTVDHDKREGSFADLKTCADINKFSAQMVTYGYYFQMAFYRKMCRLLYPKIKRWKIYIIAVDKSSSMRFKVFKVIQTKLKHYDTQIENALDSLWIGDERKLSPGLCVKCPPQLNCPYSLFKVNHIEKI